MRIRQGHIEGAPPHCPFCRTKLDGWAAFLHEHAPKSGDVTICAECRAPLIFEVGTETVLREPTVAEMAEMMAMPAFAAAGRALRDYRR